MENNNMDYRVEIIGSSHELSKREIVKLTSRANEIKIEEAFNDADGTLVISPVGYAELAVHNEHAKNDNKDFTVFVVIDANGNLFSTGSASFKEAFYNIWSTMHDDPEPWEIGVDRKPSRNYAGKYFYSCHLI